MSKPKELAQGRRGLMALLREAAHGHTLYDVFRDFCEMSAIAVSNSVDLIHRAEREVRYQETAKRYKPDVLALLPKMLGCLVEELEIGMADVLGQAYMELEISNKNTGQFFTPYSLCKMVAEMQIDDSLREKVKSQGFVTVNEPACGGGAMVIAMAEAMRNAGIEPQRHMHVVAQDVDPRSVHMTYLQLSLLHIPAVVQCGNTLTMEVSSVWRTPAHIFGGWDWKLRRRAAASADATVQISSDPVPPADIVKVPDVVLPPAGEQIFLFSEAA